LAPVYFIKPLFFARSSPPSHRGGLSTIPKAERGGQTHNLGGLPHLSKRVRHPTPPITLEKFYQFLYIGAKHASTNSSIFNILIFIYFNYKKT
jgi:hypothetical protein